MTGTSPTLNLNNYPLLIRFSYREGPIIIDGDGDIDEIVIMHPAYLPNHISFRIIETCYGKGVSTGLPEARDVETD